MSQRKLDLLESGLKLAREFCEANGLRMPDVDVVEKKNWRFKSTCAYYREDKITICPSACAAIGLGGPAWSYPGYVIDRTPHGVIAHELGHHVDFVCSGVKGSYGGDFSSRVRVASGEEKLTNYCPNDWEWFAEMFRLFVTNSDLLHAVRPRTYKILRHRFVPAEQLPWRVVLEGAPPRTIAQAELKASI